MKLSYSATLYDNACNAIGHADNVNAGSTIFSQLPYSVSSVKLGAGFDAAGDLHATLWYAGGEHRMGYGDYAKGDCSIVNGACTALRMGFPCPSY